MSIDGQYTLETPENVEVDFELAGPGSRFCAMMIDSLMMVLIVLLIAGLLLALNVTFLGNLQRAFGPTGNRLGDWLTWVNALAILLLFGILFGYYVFFEAIMRGQTPGKRSMKIRVIREDGTPAGAMDIVVRNLVRMIDALPAFYGLGGVVMFFHPMHKRLGDLAAGTIVIKERELDYRALPDKKYTMAPAMAEVANSELTAEERRLVTGFLQRRVELLPEARGQLAQRLARPLFEKYGGQYENAESYMERIMHGKHHENSPPVAEALSLWLKKQKSGNGNEP
jgi:uncharacterized RDD family membrane protein YckC